MYESTWEAVLSRPDSLALDAYVCFVRPPAKDSERVLIANEDDWQADDDQVPTVAAQSGMTDCMTRGDLEQIVANARAQEPAVAGDRLRRAVRFYFAHDAFINFNEEANAIFHVRHVSGAMSVGGDASLPALLDELSEADSDHPDVAVENENGLSLSVVAGWRLIIENVEEDSPPQWTETLDQESVLHAMELVARGHDGVEDLFDWNEGYGPTPGPNAMPDSAIYSIEAGDLRILRATPPIEWRGRIDTTAAVEVHPSSDGSTAIVLLEPPNGQSHSRNLVKVNTDAEVVWRGELPDQTSSDCFLAVHVSPDGDTIEAWTWSGYRVLLSTDSGTLLDSSFTK